MASLGWVATIPLAASKEASKEAIMPIRLHFQSPPLLRLFPVPTSKLPTQFCPYLANHKKLKAPNFIARVKTSGNPKPLEKPQPVDAELVIEEDEDGRGGGGREEEREEEVEFPHASAFRGREDEKDFDRDPEFAEILGSCLDDPQKAQSKIEERIRSKRNKILQAKTGSATPIEVIFNKFDFSNSYIWFEFYNTPLPKDVTLICDTIRSWHIIGRLGGCNSMNMQLSQSPLDTKRPKYDAVEGANVTPTTFYNIGDLEIHDNLARIWVDIGTSEPLLLDVLINALTCISSDYIGIKKLVFGGSEFENWKENLTSEDAGYSSHRI